MAFTCPQCGMVSHHPDDEKHSWCNACKEFMGERHWTRRKCHFRVEEKQMQQAGGICTGFTVEPIYSSEYELYMGRQGESICEVWADVRHRANSVRYKFQETSWIHAVRLAAPHDAMAFYAKMLHFALTERWHLALTMLNLIRDAYPSGNLDPVDFDYFLDKAKRDEGYKTLAYIYEALPEG